MQEAITKDSGNRIEFKSGMMREPANGRPRYDLIYKPLLAAWAKLMGRGADKYAARNWEKANSIEEMDRFLESFERHSQQYINFVKAETNMALGQDYYRDIDWKAYEEDKVEDHAAAICFNLGGSEFMRLQFNDKNLKKIKDLPF